MEAYKVVRPGSRCSCTADGHYKKTYSEGAIITAEDETLGIFCFETYESAKKWVESGINNWIIIKVYGLGLGQYPRRIIRHDWIDSDLKIRHYKQFLKEGENTTKVPEGTILYKSVEVLE